MPLGSLLARLTLLLSLAGVFITTMLSIAHSSTVQLPCGGSVGCMEVSLSSYSRLFGIPIAYFGLAFYLLMAILAVRYLVVPSRRVTIIAFASSVAAALVSVFYTGLSIFQLHAVCNWCLASAATSISLVIVWTLSLQKAPSEKREEKILGFVVAAVLATTAITAASPSLLAYHPEPVYYDVAAFAKTPVEAFVPRDAVNVSTAGTALNVVIFVDMECPFCHYLLPKLLSAARTGRINLYVRHLPLQSHESSVALATLCEEASNQGLAWPFLEKACKENVATPTDYIKLAQELRIDTSPGKAALVAANRVGRDQSLAENLQINETPVIVCVSGRDKHILSGFDFLQKYRNLLN